MYCKKCGTKIIDGDKCPNCGLSINPQSTYDEWDESQSERFKQNLQKIHQESKRKNKSKNKWNIWVLLSITSFLCGCVTFYKGIDKMTHYYSSEYSSHTINAYVGGDAYNYIINGTYATSFFVLTTMFILAAIGLLIVYFVSKNKGGTQDAL